MKKFLLRLSSLGFRTKGHIRIALLLSFFLAQGSYLLTANNATNEGTNAQSQVTNQIQVIKGIVREQGSNDPIAGVGVVNVETKTGVLTDAKGEFTISLPKRDRITLRIQAVGMTAQEIVWKGEPFLEVYMTAETTDIDDVVVTGLFERKTEGFTGTASTYSKSELKSVGTGNVLQNLRSLDPSMSYMTNDLYGSDPTKLPSINIRGQTSISDPRVGVENDPNQPLYIIDGFEATAREVANLNINRIESATILKDAAATAIYGSRAANGVMVIETVKPKSGKLRFNYEGNFSVQIPDLSDYNLMNADEKLQAEVLSGVYDQSYITYYFARKELYRKRRESLSRGVDTYWLKVPVRTGFNHKHSMNISGGDRTVTYSLGLDYGSTTGVMKKSGTDNIRLSSKLGYRTGVFLFQNSLALEHYSENSPPVGFATYAETHPLYEKSNNRWLEDLSYSVPTLGGINYKLSNPLYNESLKHINEREYLNFRDDISIEWRPIDGLVLKGTGSIQIERAKDEFFKSPFHTDYEASIVTKRGLYRKGTADYTNLTGRVVATYNKTFNLKHILSLNAQGSISSKKVISDQYSAIGFSDDIIPYPSFAGQYPTTGVPSYNEVITRRMSVSMMAAYSYEYRYAVDFTFSNNGTSNFGKGNPYSNHWAIGTQWNLHNEEFLKDKFSILRLKLSIGETGNDNKTYSIETTYRYTNLSNLFGGGLYINQFGNSWLDWEKTLEQSLGLDLETKNRRFAFSFELWKKMTDPLIVNLDTPSSTGRENMKMNKGRNTNTGFSFNARFNIFNDYNNDVIWTVGVNGSRYKTKLSKMGEMSKDNDELRELKSYVRLVNGASMQDLWAVRSAGIDPASGQEIFIKKDGSGYTFTHDIRDEVKVGNSNPELQGRIYTNFRYKGFTMSIYLNYLIGRDMMNTTLRNRVEGVTNVGMIDYNLDKRALYNRWQRPGDMASFKNIRSLGSSLDNKISDRFLQRQSYLAGEAITVGYSFDKQRWLKSTRIENVTVQASFYDLFHWSSVLIERGINYPYSRTATLSVSITF